MDREKVINKVKAIVADMQEEVDEWKDYSDSELRDGLTCDCDWWYKTLQTLKDALALLKAQEPHVLMIDEARQLKRDTVVWYEHIGINKQRPRIVDYADESGIIFTDGGHWSFKVDAYGKKFRIWTAHPNDAEREAVKWE